MKKLKRGERNWSEGEGDSHPFPEHGIDDLEQVQFRTPGHTFMVHGHEYIIALDGKIERVDS